MKIRRRQKKEKASLTREDLQNMQKVSKEELLKISQGLGDRMQVVENLLRLTPRERLRLMKARMRIRRRHG